MAKVPDIYSKKPYRNFPVLNHKFFYKTNMAEKNNNPAPRSGSSDSTKTIRLTYVRLAVELPQAAGNLPRHN